MHTQPTELTLISQSGDADLTNISIRANISKMSSEKSVINTLELKKDSVKSKIFNQSNPQDPTKQSNP